MHATCRSLKIISKFSFQSHESACTCQPRSWWTLLFYSLKISVRVLVGLGWFDYSPAPDPGEDVICHGQQLIVSLDSFMLLISFCFTLTFNSWLTTQRLLPTYTLENFDQHTRAFPPGFTTQGSTLKLVYHYIITIGLRHFFTTILFLPKTSYFLDLDQFFVFSASIRLLLKMRL